MSNHYYYVGAKSIKEVVNKIRPILCDIIHSEAERAAVEYMQLTEVCVTGAEYGIFIVVLDEDMEFSNMSDEGEHRDKWCKVIGVYEP